MCLSGHIHNLLKRTIPVCCHMFFLRIDISANVLGAPLAKEQLVWTPLSVPVVSASCLARTRWWQTEIWNRLGQTCKPSWHLDILPFSMDTFLTCWSMPLLECTSNLAVSCPVAKYVSATMSKNHRKSFQTKKKTEFYVFFINHTFLLCEGHWSSSPAWQGRACVLICLGLVASLVWPFISLVGNLHARMGS